MKNENQTQDFHYLYYEFLSSGHNNNNVLLDKSDWI